MPVIGEFDCGEVRTETVLDAAAERQHGQRWITCDIEPFGVVVDLGISVGRSGVVCQC
jgi:hypothetical protein